ncbi:methylenetetrahydrofolate reductase C-terminal domain-containing protein [Calderihabitans maritimus]|uniref:Zinc-finger protein n=1 Tax=Calderihabitans maritimus TaxID=1246530 RepID=A0A1Z5HT98_9FIRM|nr:methylenetetrahydrofolate reductase C-terminal domain-containing protein [Calderihabitans maritimus]GAW92749.1 zinc-finger protein [Calderihabitans maritimus]
MGKCLKCKTCLLLKTGGICPIMHCAKGLVNGPCGGAQNECCEIGFHKKCAWLEIFQRCSKSGKLVLSFDPAIKDYSNIVKQNNRNVS